MQSLSSATMRNAPQLIKQLSRPLVGASTAVRQRQGPGIDLWRVTQKSCSTMVHLNQGQSGDLRKRVLVTHLLKKVYTVSVEMLKGKGQPPTGPQHAKAQRAIAATAQRAPAVDVALDNATPEQVGPAAISQGDGRKVRRRSLGSAFKGLFGKRSASPKLDAGGDSVV